MLGRLVALSLLLGVALTSGCGEPDDGLPASAALRPGDSLLERLADGRLLQYPATNLARPVAALVGPTVPWSSVAIEPGRWRNLGELDRARVPFWLRRREVPVYTWSATLDFPVPDADAGAALRFVQGDRSLRQPDDGNGPGDDLVVSWNPSLDVLLAIAPERPRGVAVIRERDAREVLGHLERRLAEPAGGLPGPAALRHRITLEGVEHDGLLLPAPARLALPVGRLAVDGLRFGVALEPVGFRVNGGAIQQVSNSSDGVVCALEVDTGGGPRRVWERALSLDDGLVEVRVDLSALVGERATLTLVSEPGPQRRNAGDYLVFTGLRAEGPPGRDPPRPHVVLIDIDTLRADALGAALGPGGPSVTPRLDAWCAARAQVFEDCQSVASWTLPATASLLTGLAVHQHGLRHHDVSLPAEAAGLASRLSAAGYEARAWTEGGYVHPSFGFGAGFERYATAPQRGLDWQAPLDWLAARRSERPVFLFVHSYMVHAPYPYEASVEDGSGYDGPLAGQAVDYDTVIHPVERGELSLSAADRAYVRRQYLAGVMAMDARVGAFLDGLERLFGDQPYVVALTSDHGELLGEHAMIDHHVTLFDEVLAVPLVLSLPGTPAARRADPASLLDVLPTLLDAAGLAVPAELPGRSLLGPARPDVPRVAQHDHAAHSLIVGDTKLIVGRTQAREPEDQPPRLFDRATDPGEVSDLAADRPDDVARMRARLQAWLARWPALDEGRRADRDGATNAALRALGYLGGDGQGADER